MNDAAVSGDVFNDAEQSIPDGPLALHIQPTWNVFFGDNTRRTVLYNTYNSTDAVLIGPFNLSRWLKPFSGDVTIAPPLLTEISPDAMGALWPEGGDHSNIIYHWHALALEKLAGAGAAGSNYIERFGAKNIDLTPYGRYKGLLKATQSHTYMMDYRFSEVWKAFEIFRDLLRP